MLLPDEIGQTIDQRTDALERIPRTLSQQRIWHGPSESMIQEQHTDALPLVTFDIPDTTVAWWQTTQVHEDNEYLRSLLEQQHNETQQLISEYSNIKGEFDREIQMLRHSHQQEIAHYQQHLQEVIAQRNRLEDAYQELAQCHQELFHNFQASVKEETQKQITQAMQTFIQSPGEVPVLFQALIQTIEPQFRLREDKHLSEALYLKREASRIIQLLEQERQKINKKYQQLFAQQYSIREQAQLREETLRARLYARWKTVSLVTSLGLLALLVVLQFLFIFLLHAHITSIVSLSITAPIILCVMLALILAKPVDLLRYMYLSAPHKKKMKRSV